MRLYVADDNEEFSQFVSRVAKSDGWAVTTCANGAMLAAAVASEDGPALMIVDINMPEVDGIQVIEELKSINRRLRIRFITGGSHSSALAARMIAEARGLESGRFITKPVGIDKLKAILREEAVHLFE
ncbi:response regulator transcription factor [Epibacterium sp. Ofav1-8]|uniref:response regulator transcription factor n=1 Tax=Epibacterium sp. Ofav1-8 TaxID=2917735 RepID=UPI001EF63F50|nr:response regulator [Epibacterium sp. Ofav1-8]MCG7624993.1 response regulator [Epibacterium sp. Ofav1-8]